MVTPLRRRRRGAHRTRTWPLTAALALLLLLPALYVLAGGRLPWERPAGRRGGAAPRGQTLPAATFTPGEKQGFGTAYTYEYSLSIPPSRVWFTLQAGALSDVYYPDLNTPQLRQMRFLVGDGRSWTADVTRDALLSIRRPDPQALFFELTARDPQGRYTLTQEVLTDPDRDSVALRVSLRTTDPALHLYLVLDPYPGGTAADNTLRYEIPPDAGPRPPYARITAVAEGRGHAAALATSVPWQAFTATFAGPQDAVQQLQAGHAFPEQYDIAARGPAAGLIDLGAPAQPFDLTVGFGRTAADAAAKAQASLDAGWEALRQGYLDGWHFYLNQRISLLDGRETPLYQASLMVIKAAEDKVRRGAIVVAPWGDAMPERLGEDDYRVVRTRDLCQAATALWAAGDANSARAALDFAARLMRPDGSFSPSVTLDAGSRQSNAPMDAVADPIILAWRLGAQDLYSRMVKPAARFLLEHGPATPLERWEESGGYSPATMAAEIAALILAAQMAEKAGEGAFAHDLLLAADRWHEDLEARTFTRTGPLAGGSYYLRIAPGGDPDAATPVNLANGAGSHDQRQVVDPSFLGLVRLGVRSARSPQVLATLPAVDTLKVNTPAGPSWYRYSFDRYGDPEPGNTERRGRLWVLLTGERGMYELAAGNAVGARNLLQAMERMAGGGDMLAEQVWEQTGRGSESATPLIWSHAAYVNLFVSLLRGQVADLPAPVYQRYGARF